MSRSELRWPSPGLAFATRWSLRNRRCGGDRPPVAIAPHGRVKAVPQTRCAPRSLGRQSTATADQGGASTGSNRDESRAPWIARIGFRLRGAGPSTRQGTRPLIAAVTIFICLLPSRAFAAGALNDEAFYNVVLLLAAVGVGYAVTHLVLGRLASRFAVVSGVEYIVLGAFVGPLLGIIDPENAEDLRPILLVGAGALGMFLGLEARELWTTAIGSPATGGSQGVGKRTEPTSEGAQGVRRAAILIAASTLLMTSGVMMLAMLIAGQDVTAPDAWTAAILIFGAASLGSDGSAIRAIGAHLDARGPALARGVRAAAICNITAVLTFGLIFALLRAGDTFALRVPLEFARACAIQIGGGCVIGLVFAALLQRELDERALFAVVIGMVVFCSGFAFSMQMSTMFVNFVCGFVFIATCRDGAQVREMLVSVRRPFVIAIFFFAGLEWSVGPLWTFALVVPLLALRYAGRRIGGVLGARAVEPVTELGAATFAPGGLMVAFLLSTRIFYGHVPGVRELYAPALIAVVISEFWSLRWVRSWLLDAADVPPEAQRRTGGIGVDLEGL